jgi:hypothetical protein
LKEDLNGFGKIEVEIMEILAWNEGLWETEKLSFIVHQGLGLQLVIVPTLSFWSLDWKML